jgi:hypothetical protein
VRRYIPAQNGIYWRGICSKRPRNPVLVALGLQLAHIRAPGRFG